MNVVNNFICRFRLISILQLEANRRNLLSSASLGLVDFEAVRNKYLTKNDINEIKFREKMKSICNSSRTSYNLVFTEDLKQMIYTIQPNEEDLNLFERMVLNFHSQNSHLRFGSFVFGPVVMRMFHTLNKPQEALKLFKNENLNGFFNQLSSYVILMDLLFENKMYQEVVDVYKILRSGNHVFGKYPKSIMIILFGAYYKLDSPEYYTEALNLFNEMINSGNYPLRRTLCFMSMLALNQNEIDVCLNVLSTSPSQNFYLIRSIKALALSHAGKIDEAILILKSVLNYDVPNQPKRTFPIELVEKVEESVSKFGSKDLLYDFSRVKKKLEEQNHLTNNTLDNSLCSEVIFVNQLNKNALEVNTVINSGSVHRKDHQHYQRIGLTDMVE